MEPAAPAPAPQNLPAHLQVTDAERAFLLEHGYLVKLNVIPEAECEAAQNSFEVALKKLNPKASASSPKNWAPEDMPSNLHGIQEVSKLAHLQCVKDIRLHPNVLAVWRSLLRTNDVCTSWDRVSYMPSHYTDSLRAWHHTDVGPSFFDRQDLQGYIPIQSYVQVSATSSPELRTLPLGTRPDADPCLVIWEHSNLAHKEFFKRKGPHFSLKTPNWFVYPPSTVEEWERDGRDLLPKKHPAKHQSTPFPMPRREIRAPRGAMVFWFSATAHMNTAGSCPLGRFVIYVCFGPQHLLTKEDRRHFWQAMEEQRCTSHWPCAGQMKVFPLVPAYYNAPKAAAFSAMSDLLQCPALEFTPEQLAVLPKPVPK